MNRRTKWTLWILAAPIASLAIFASPSLAGPAMAIQVTSKGLSGQVQVLRSECRVRQVKIYAVKPGKDPQAAATKSGSSGEWEVKSDFNPGKYYARIEQLQKGDVTCAAAKSATVTVR